MQDYRRKADQPTGGVDARPTRARDRMGGSGGSKSLREFEPVVLAAKPPSRIPEGDYTAVCYRADYAPGYHGQRTLYVKFRIYVGEWDGAELFMACPAIHKRLRERHKLHRQWALAIGRQPTTKERFNKRVFENKLYRVRVRFTDRKVEGSKESLPQYMQYSVVDTILEAMTGVATV